MSVFQLFVLSYLGIGASFVQPLFVPIIVRSLAQSFARLDEDQLPIGVDFDFLSLLDSNLSQQHTICKIVNKYECQWWTITKVRSLKSAEILD
jgi:hypothetical protein